jgi:WD40 repeat protein
MGLALWDAQSGVLLRTLKSADPHTVSLFPLGWSPDSQSIAVSDYWAGKVYVWRVADGTHLFTCDGISVNWSPDGRYLLTGSGPDGPFLAWVRDARTGTLLLTYEGFAQASGLRQGANFSDILAWSPDSKRVAMGVGDTVHLWDALDGGNLTQYHMPNIDALIWLPGSDLIITGDNSGQVSSWNVADGKVVHTYKQLDPTVVSRTWALTSTPDGAFLAAGFLASGSPEKLVQVWETQSGKLLFQYQLQV